MKLTHKIKSILLIVMTLGFYHCGSDGTQTTINPNTGAFDGLYVVSSSPGHNQFYVSETTQTLVVRMSEAVNQATVANQIQLVKTVSGQEQNVTSSYNISVNGEMITLQGSGNLSTNADYQIRLYPGLASVAGNTLLQGQSFQYFFVDFSTGNGGNLGQSQPGAPTVSNISRSNSFSCFGALMQFNESLAYQPVVTIEYKDFMFQWHTINVYPMPAQSNNQSQWRVDLDNSFCSDIITGSKIKVHVEDYVDLEGNHGTAHTEEFNFWL